MSSNPKSVVLTTIEKTIRPTSDAIQKDHDDQLTRLLPLIAQLDTAIKKKDAAVLQKLRGPFDEQVKFASALVVRASKLAEALGKLNATTPDEQKAKKEMAARLEKQERVLQKNLLSLRGGQDKVQDAYEVAAGVANQFAEEWARIEDLLESYRTNARLRVEQAEGFLRQAKAAVADRDRKKLPELQASAAKVRAGTPSNIEVQQAWRQFLAKPIPGGVDESARDQFKRELPKLKKILDEGAALEAPIGQLHMQIEALAIGPVDKQRAVELLGVPPADVQTFSDILSLKVSAMETYLNVVGKNLKPPKSGKQILEALQQAKLV